MKDPIEGVTGFTLSDDASTACAFLFYGQYDHRVVFAAREQLPHIPREVAGVFATHEYTIKPEYLGEYTQPRYYMEPMTREEFIDSYPTREKGLAILEIAGL